MSRKETNETPSRTISDCAPRRPSWRALTLELFQPCVGEVPPRRLERLEALHVVADRGAGRDEVHRCPRRVLHRLPLDLHPESTPGGLIRCPVGDLHLVPARRVAVLRVESLLPGRPLPPPER